MQGCSLKEMQVQPDESQQGPYKVQIYNEVTQQPASKVAVDEGFCTGDKVGVYLVNYDGQTPGTLKVEGNQADNVRFTFDENGNWISDYDIFYKDNETNVDFYAYYPYADPTSIETYPFEVARNQSKGAENGQMAPYEASDFLWATRKNVTPTESKVILSFRHMMSCARVRFNQGSGWDNEAEFAAVKKEVLVTSTIRKATIDLSTGVVTPEGEAPLTGIVPMVDNGDFRAIVVPQTVAAGKTLLTITIDGKPRNYVLNEDTQYVPGKITTYDLAVKKVPNTGEYEVEITGVSITAWEADNVSHGDDAREYVVVHNAVAGQLEWTIVERLEMNPTKIKNLKLLGKINTTDYTFMRDKMTSLQRLNLKEVESLAGDGYEIPKKAFTGKTTLIKCILPDKLDKISNMVSGENKFGAFDGTSLTGTLVLPEGLKYVSGFARTKITNVYFPSTLEEIGVCAFEGCAISSEITLPESVKKIDKYAFSSTGIKGSLILPRNLESIEDYAFESCGGLKGSLIIPDKISKIPNGAFQNCSFSGTLTLPQGLTEIESKAFYNVPFKGELRLPSSLLVIGAYAFSNTLFSGTLKFPTELVSLGSNAFENCWRLSGTMEIPENVISVPSSLFSGCTGLEGIKLHKYIEVIGAGAFYNCTGVYSLVSEAKNPPTIYSTSFKGVAKDNFTLEVPEASVSRYRTASNWNEFKRISAHREFSISRHLYRTLNAEHSKTFVLRAPAGENWSVESKPDWVTVEPMSGVGKMDVTVKPNTLANGAGNRSGEIKFLLDGKEYRCTMIVEQYDYQYGDGDVVTLQESTKGNGVNIVLVGDCFDAKDISEGKYLNAIQEAYGYFFDMEPYLTYKDYFNVYGVFGMSADSGLGTANTIREARFGSQYTLYEGVAPDFETTFAAACLAPINDNVSHTLIIMVENSADYSGLCYMWGDGSAVALVPMSTDSAPYDFRGLVHHEAGGHGFGKLADEYIYHIGFIQSCDCGCCKHVDELSAFKSYGFYDNVSLTGSMKDVPWAHMIYDPQYSNVVDVYEGAFFHTRGVFRSEPTSCMHNNIPYYNAISREAMVKRIMKYAGESYSYEDFKAKDYESHPQVTTKGTYLWSGDASTSTSSRFDQHPPKLMGDKPSFKKSAF